MKKLYLVLTFLLFTSAIVSSQNFSAKVKDSESGEFLNDVTVTAVRSGKIQVTDANGYFSFGGISFPLKLKFSFIGYKTSTEIFDASEEGKIIDLQRDIDVLSEVVLRSSNIPQKLLKESAAVSVLSAEDLERVDDFNLVQNLNYVPGVFVSQGALNTNKIDIRGIGARAQYSTNRIKAYINGIPLTTAEGELTLDDFDNSYLDRIEIYKGPVSSIFGAGLGGAINLYTQRNRQDQRSVETSFSYGSFKTMKTGVNVNYVEDSLDIAINYNKLDTDGYRDNGAYDRNSFVVTAGLLNRKGNRWDLFYNYTNLKAFIPSSLNQNDFLNSPTKAAFTWGSAEGYESYDKNILGLAYTHNFSESWRNQTTVFLNSRDGYEPRPFDILDENRNSIGLRTNFNHETSIASMPAKISFGAEGMLEFYEVQTYQNLYQDFEDQGSVQGNSLSNNEQDRNYINFFGLVQMELTSKLTADLGVNFNTTSYDLQDNFNQDSADQSGNYSFDAVLSPRLGLSYEAFAGKHFYASASHGFSTPTVSQTLTPEGNINTDLQTETGWNYEIGFKGNWLENRLYTEVNAYSIQIRDLLVARRIDQDRYVGVNAGKSDHYGLEFTSIYQHPISNDLSLNLMLNANLTDYTFDKFVDLGENYSGNELPGVPEYMLTPTIGFDYMDFSANINYQMFGEMALDDSNSGYTEAYELLNFRMNYNTKLTSYLQAGASFGINNITDELYASSIVTNAVGFGGSAPRYYYPGMPRNYYAGLNLKLSL